MKKYNNEKAIISLTSWKARINTVSKTIFSLLKQCPDFHIVLVLSEEEFTNKEKDLPEDLMSFVNNDLIELVWVYKNYKSFKKIIFTIEKYKNKKIPIISADDDCIYNTNYAEELYKKWETNKDKPIRYRESKLKENEFCMCGPASLYPPILHEEIIQLKTKLTDDMINKNSDDGLFMSLLKHKKIKPLSISDHFPCTFHDEICPINGKANDIYGKIDKIEY